MAKKNEARGLIDLVCSECKNISKRTSKNKKNDPERLELNVYCPICRKHTPHKEKK